MTLSEVIDDHFLVKYRGLLDAEDAAFDELEHACEDGDRAPYEAALGQWQRAIEKKLDRTAKKNTAQYQTHHAFRIGFRINQA